MTAALPFLDLDALRRWHGYQDSVSWRLTPQGLEVGDQGVRGSGGRPLTVTRIWQEHGAAIGNAAAAYGVPAELILATIATESGGRRDARREEPGYVSEWQTPHRVSIGLMQTLVSTARRALDMPRLPGAALREPAVSIKAGTRYIANQAPQTGLDPPKVACAYNAGGIFHQHGVRNRWRMRQFPIGTGAHADRFVIWFNDAFRLFAGEPAKAPQPSFVALLHDPS